MRIRSAEQLIEEYPENQVDMRSYGMIGSEREKKEGYSHGRMGQSLSRGGRACGHTIHSLVFLNGGTNGP